MKISIDDEKYVIDVKKAIELGVLKEEEKFSLMPERIKGGKFFYLDEFRRINCVYEKFYDIDDIRYNCGNYFKSKEVIQCVIDNNLNPFDKIHNYIAHKNVELGWSFDWKDCVQEKYTLYFDNRCEFWTTECTYSLEVCKVYSTKEVIEELIDKLNNINGDE